MEENTFSITDSAANRIIELLADEQPDSKLRIVVEGGGCSGFQYNFKIDTAIEPSAMVIEKNGAKVLIDDVSLGFIKGSELDFVETLGEAAFKIQNPNATAKCGCGNSFAV